MTNLTPTAWIESQDFRDVVNPDQHADFLANIAAAHAEGYVVTRVVVIGGVPVVYERREASSDD